MNTTDKTDIIMALREVALGIEQDAPNALELMQALGTEMLVLALKTGPALERIEPERVETLVRGEVAAIVDSIGRYHDHFIEESDVLNERLLRQFDPSQAFNEAVNRAIEAKKAAREEIITMTPLQETMFQKYQVPTGLRALRTA